jgi:serine O-acetyltransferase
VIYISPIPLYRASSWLFHRRVPFLPRILEVINRQLTHCDIPPNVVIGKNPRFQHGGFGVIINAKTHIGDNVVFMPLVVIGQSVSKGFTVNELERIVIGNDVLFGAGAKVIAKGRLTIGDGAAIGANAVVTKDVAPDTTVVGIPARPLERPIDRSLIG